MVIRKVKIDNDFIVVYGIFRKKKLINNIDNARKIIKESVLRG